MPLFSSRTRILNILAPGKEYSVTLLFQPKTSIGALQDRAALAKGNRKSDTHRKVKTRSLRTIVKERKERPTGACNKNYRYITILKIFFHREMRGILLECVENMYSYFLDLIVNK